MINHHSDFTLWSFRMSWCWDCSFSVAKGSNHWAGYTESKIHRWHCSGLLDFVIHNFRINNANVQKIEEYTKVKSDLASLVNLIRNFHLVAQIYYSHVRVILTDNSKIIIKIPSLSLLNPWHFYWFLGQHLDYGN